MLAWRKTPIPPIWMSKHFLYLKDLSLINTMYRKALSFSCSSTDYRAVKKNDMSSLSFSQDTAGDEKYSGLSHFYCRSAGAAILAYDINDPKTFESLW